MAFDEMFEALDQELVEGVLRRLKHIIKMNADIAASNDNVTHTSQRALHQAASHYRAHMKALRVALPTLEALTPGARFGLDIRGEPFRWTRYRDKETLENDYSPRTTYCTQFVEMTFPVSSPYDFYEHVLCQIPGWDTFSNGYGIRDWTPPPTSQELRDTTPEDRLWNILLTSGGITIGREGISGETIYNPVYHVQQAGGRGYRVFEREI